MKANYKLLILISLAVFASCSKDSNSPSTPKSTTELLTANQWLITSLTAKKKDGTTVPDQFPTLPTYDKDNYYQFNADLSFSYNDNVIKTPGAISDRLDFGNWKLINSDTYLELVSKQPLPAGQSITYFPTKITEITTTGMKWEVYDDVGSTLYVTLTKK